MSLKIGITGADGLVGWHLRAWLYAYRPEAEVRLATRVSFADPSTLIDFASGLDAIVHCAGQNRGDDAQVEATNVDLATRLTSACESAVGAGARYPHVVFTNSTHVTRDTAYGRGKRVAAEILAMAAARHDSPYTNLILPHIFGEFGKPFYNSVVSTFCHQLIAGETPQVNADGDLELLHTQAAAARFVAAIETREAGEQRVAGVPMKVSALLRKLQAMTELYLEHCRTPDLSDALDLALFNTLRSYRFARQPKISLSAGQDYRALVDELTRGGARTQPVTIAPHAVEGNYFSTQNFERICVESGNAVVHVRRLFSHETQALHTGMSKTECLDIPTFHTYSIMNEGDSDLVVLRSTAPHADSTQLTTFTEAVL